MATKLIATFSRNTYPIKGNLKNNHWVNFSCKKMNRFIHEYGDDFNLVIYWGDPQIGLSYYLIPYSSLKSILIEENTAKQEGKRWILTISKDNRLHINGKSINIDVSRFLCLPSDDDLFNDTINIKSNPEGDKRLQIHYSIERDSSFIRKIKRAYYLENHDMPCQVCGESFVRKYGELGLYYIEAHHKKPLSELREPTENDVHAFSFVCANCHRMLHREIPAISTEQLIAKLKKKGRKR